MRVMTRSQLSATAKQNKNTKRLSGCEIDLSSEAIREVQSGEVCLRNILDLLDAGSPWFTVEGADLKVQQLYAQWETYIYGMASCTGIFGYQWPTTLEAIVGFTLSKSTSASASSRGAYGRPHGRQEDAGQGDADGLLEGMEGRRGDVL